MARKPLYPQQNDNVGGEVVLKKRRKGGCLKKLLISLAISVAVFIVTVVVALLVGNGILKSKFGISLFDLFGCMSDLKGVKAENVVTNPYEDGEKDVFYDALGSSLFLNDGVVNEEYITGITDAATSGGDIGSAVTSIITRESFSEEKLAAYDTTSPTVQSYMTDRAFAAFLNDFMIGSGKLDELAGDMSSVLGESKLSDIISLEQAIMCSASDLTDAEKEVYAADEDGVYLTVTFSLDIKTTIKSAMENFGAGGFVWLANMFLPENAYFSVTFDLTDASYGAKLNVNDMAFRPCKMNYMNEAAREKYGEDTTQYDRLCIIIEGFSGTDVNEWLSSSMSGLTSLLCMSDGETESAFCFADFIDLDSVSSSESGGNSFALDAFGFLTENINAATGGTADTSDVIALMQSLICAEYNDAYDVSSRVDLYASDMTAFKAALTQCGFATAADIRSQSDLDRLTAVYSGIAYDEPNAPVNGMINVFEQMFMDEFSTSYGISMDKPSGGEYGFADLMSLAETSDINSFTPDQQELAERIATAYAASASTGAQTVFAVNDKMFGAVLRNLSDMYDTETGIQLRSVEIIENGDKQYADLVFTLGAGALIADDTIGAILPDYISVGVRADITTGATQREAATLVSFNGITESGGSEGIEELTCGRLQTAIESVLPSVSFDEILTSVTDGLGVMVDNMNEHFPGLVFVPLAEQ